MKGVHESILECVGNTPLVRLQKMTAGMPHNVWAKLEFLNPAGSMKDRVAMKIIDDYEKKGLLRPGGTIVEATSGNTGAGLALVAALRGYNTIFVLPDKQSEEKRAALRAWGARVVVTPTNVAPDDPNSYYKVAERIAKETPNSVYANQYHNPANPQAHYEWTGPELYDQLDGKIDVFIAGLGTGGTISGIGKYLKEKNPQVKVIGVDPVGSLYYDYFHTGQMVEPYTYLVEGIGEDFLPSTMDFNYVDDVVRVDDQECFVATRRLLRSEGLFAGPSSGAAITGALKYLRRVEQKVNAVVLLPDGGSRYLSKVYNDNWMRENGFLDRETIYGVVGDVIKGRGPRELVSVHPDARVSEVVGLLKLHGISQVPVVQGDTLVGILSENRLLERALKGGPSTSKVADLVEADFCTVTPETEVHVLTQLFRRHKCAIVLKDYKPADIVTRIDVIDFIGSLARPATTGHG